jgi:hypothetical protein
MTSLFAQLAAVLLGLLTGAMLLIGVALVPWWSSLDPLAFSAWFAAHASLIGRLMVPLGGLATLSILLAFGVAARRRAPGWQGLGVAAAGALFVAAIYPVYYTDANAALASGSLTPAEITAELARWRAWHWARVFAGALAFASAVHACARPGQAGSAAA